MILLDATDLRASRPGRPLFGGVSLAVSSGDRIAIVGLNGSGKTTLLRQLTGVTSSEGAGGGESGGVVRRGRDARFVVLDQDAALPGSTVGEAITAATSSTERGEWEGAAILQRLGMGGRLDDRLDTLSGGEAKRVALARALVELGPPTAPSDDVVLILDEPTNHLDIDAIAWLEARLLRHRGALLLVTHDRHLLDRLTNKIIEIDRGTAYVHAGGYAGYLGNKAEREEQAVRTEQSRRNLARTELAWLRRGAPARTSKPKARIEAATELVNARPQAAARAGELDLAFGTPRLGDTVVELAGVGHRFGGPAAPDAVSAGRDGWLFRGVDLVLDRRERLGIIGPNGAGKSTLLDVIGGRLAPQEGTVATGTTVRLGIYDQRGRELDGDLTVAETVAGPHRQPDWEDARFLERFWFDADAQRAPVRLLSGGERRRLQLVLTLRAKPNLLLLDEPTNDLDLDTLRVLEDLLDEWPGALVVVSHDRAFLERTVADVLVIDEHLPGRRVPGGFGAWSATRAAAPPRPAPAGPAPAPRPADAGRPELARRLRELDKQLAVLTRRRTVLADELTAAGTDVDKLRAAGTAVAEADTEIAATEELWLELSTQLDELR
ncbi:MAG TPA: ABC-F family ATP-binding cassette domain-containing protein [Ilumatobacter sp.]|nr:ABC-F family ATP-binding cassette domain-containing protein [Ilumatobacter sp.]